MRIRQINYTIHRLLFFLLVLITPIVAYSQKQSKVDSLLKIEQSLEIKEDTNHVLLLCKLANFYDGFNVEKSFSFAKKALGYAKKINYLKGIAKAQKIIGYYYNSKGNYALSLEHFMSEMKIHKANYDYFALCDSYNAIGNCLIGYGKIDKALEAYLDGYKLAVKNNYKTEQGILAIGIGNCYIKLNDPEKALEYAFKSKNIFKKENNNNLIPYSETAIAAALSSLKRYEEAFKYYNSSIYGFKKLKNQYGIASSYQELALAHQEVKNYDNAIFYNNKARKIFIERKANDNLKDISLSLSKCHLAKKDFKNAHIFQVSYSNYKDSILNDNVNNKILEFQAKYETEKQQKEIEIKNALISEKDAKINEEVLRTKILYLISGIIILLLIMLSIGYVIIRKNNAKLNTVNNNLEIKNKVIKEKSTEITNSINYAQRIQNAILPTDKIIKKYLKESFVLYKPKDIVAGDFYWLEKSGNKILIAAADCTGHGVPGAMVSMVCNNSLNRSVREHNLTDPGKVLDKTREIVIQEFEKSEEDVKDGMDIALCCIEENSLKYAGALNPLWIIRDSELLETKANKQPIGQFENPKPFTTHTIHLEKGDSIYIFSDGYADQFGGEKGKKLKRANFKKLLLSIQNETMQKQQQLLDEAFKKWKGNLEQVDDVCVIGVRI